MRLTLADWSIVALYFLFNVAVGLPPGLPAAVPGVVDNLNHPRLGKPRDGEDPATAVRHGQARGPGDVLGLIVLTSAISTLSGLWGVLVTDLFQFVIKMGMVIVLAVVAVHAVGGIEAMKAKLALIDQARAASGRRGPIPSFVSELGSVWMPVLAFFLYIGVD